MDNTVIAIFNLTKIIAMTLIYIATIITIGGLMIWKL